MLQKMRKSILVQVIVAIIFTSLFLTSIISLILFNMSTNYIEAFYEYASDSDRLNNVIDLLSFEEYRALFFSRLVMLIMIASVVSIYIAVNLAELITAPITRFSDYVSRSADDILNQPMSQDLLNNPNEIGKLARSFDDMRLRILSSFDQKQESMSTLVRGVSHQLNTPIGNALSSASFLEYIVEKDKDMTDDLRDKLTEAIDLTNSSLKQTLDILNMFRSISVYENDLKEKTFDLGEYIQQYVSLVSADGKNSHIYFKVNVEPNMFVRSYPTTIMQIITALVTNTREHGYCEDASGKCIVHVDAFRNKSAVHIIYKDFGIGIPEHVRQQIFEPFFTTKPFGQKTGLGLSIVYNQVQKLGGTIECLPDKDGAAFLIKLDGAGGAHE